MLFTEEHPCQTCELHPAKMTEKKYKEFSQLGKYAALWQPEIREV